MIWYFSLQILELYWSLFDHDDYYQSRNSFVVAARFTKLEDRRRCHEMLFGISDFCHFCAKPKDSGAHIKSIQIAYKYSLKIFH